MSSPAESRRQRVERLGGRGEVALLELALIDAQRYCGRAHQREVESALERARKVRDDRIANIGAIHEQRSEA